MRKIFFITTTFLLAFLISCTNSSGDGMSEKAKKNLDAHRGVVKAIESGDLSKLGDYIAEDAVDHAGETGDIKGLENIRAEMAKYAQHSEKMKSEVIKELADDEYVMAWLRFTGTMKEDQMGMKKGDNYNMTSIEVSKHNSDGKVTEHWSFMQPSELMNMMGTPGPAVGGDTTKMKTDSVKKSY